MKRIATSRARVYLTCSVFVFMVSLVSSVDSAAAQQAKFRVNFVPPPAGDASALVHYLEKETGLAVELTAAKNAEEAAEGIANNKIDVANLGGLEFVQSAAHAGAKPLVQREEDQRAQTAFVTQPDSNIHSLSDLNGHTLAFANVTSVSSHVMPEYYLREAKVDPKVIETAIFTDRDGTVLAVASRKVDVGFVNPGRLRAMLKDGRVKDDQVRVFWTSPPFADTVWAARGGLDPKLAESFATALLKLDAKNPEHKPILDLLQATKYARAKDSSYDQLRQGAKAAGLLK
jgi:phosphonate transport system substrate-binding protein